MKLKQTFYPALTYILSGSLEKRQSKNKDDTILYLDLDSRVLCIQNNRVSSVTSDPKLVIQKLKDDNENLGFFAVISSQESDHFAHLSKLKVVRKNGKNMVKTTASSNELDASGKYAQDSINLDRIPEGKVTMTIMSKNELTTSSIVEDWFGYLLQKVRSQNVFAEVDWRRLPGASPIEYGSQWNWYYIAKKTKKNEYPALEYEDKFVFKGVDKNGDITNQAGFSRSELPQNISYFGIYDFESWKRQYGVLFGLQSW